MLQEAFPDFWETNMSAKNILKIHPNLGRHRYEDQHHTQYIFEKQPKDTR